MRLGIFLPPKPDHRWALAAQAGVHYAVGRLRDVYPVWELDALAEAQQAYRAGGFELTALEGDQFDMTRIKLGLPGRDEDLERYCAMFENMGKLGIVTFCYNFMAGVGWFRSRNDEPARGGALASGFHPEDVPEEPLKFLHEKLWENYRYFLNAVQPAAEAAGVWMGLHPDDPPVPVLKGYPRIMNSADAYRKVFALAGGSANVGCTFCAATFRAMGENDLALLGEFRRKIRFVHMRDNQPLPDGGFVETFHDAGPTDLVERFSRIASLLPEDTLVRPDHAPTMNGEDNSEPGYAAMGRVYAIGYFKGILDAFRINYR